MTQTNKKKILSPEEQAEFLLSKIMDPEIVHEERVQMMLNLLARVDNYRRNANAAFQLIKGSEICVKAFNHLREANYVSISWGEKGTPETVAAEYMRCMEAMAAGDYEVKDFGDGTGQKEKTNG